MSHSARREPNSDRPASSNYPVDQFEISIPADSDNLPAENRRERVPSKEYSKHQHKREDGARPNPVWGDDVPLNLDVAAEYTGMPLPTFKQKIYGREITSVKVGRRRRVRPSAIRAYLQRHEQPAL